MFIGNLTHDFNSVRRDMQRLGQNANRQQGKSVKVKKIIENCKYC